MTREQKLEAIEKEIDCLLEQATGDQWAKAGWIATREAIIFFQTIGAWSHDSYQTAEQALDKIICAWEELI